MNGCFLFLVLSEEFRFHETFYVYFCSAINKQAWQTKKQESYWSNWEHPIVQKQVMYAVTSANFWMIHGWSIFLGCLANCWWMGSSFLSAPQNRLRCTRNCGTSEKAFLRYSPIPKMWWNWCRSVSVPRMSRSKWPCVTRILPWTRCWTACAKRIMISSSFCLCFRSMRAHQLVLPLKKQWTSSANGGWFRKSRYSGNQDHFAVLR